MIYLKLTILIIETKIWQQSTLNIRRLLLDLYLMSLYQYLANTPTNLKAKEFGLFSINQQLP